MLLRNAFRWIARILGSLIGFYWLFMGVMGAIYDKESFTWQSVFMVIFIIATVFAFTIGWWRERLAGICAVLTGIAQSFFAFFVSGHNKWFAVMIAGVPVLSVGILYLLSWQLCKRQISV